jgi:hypothetical protein
VIYSRKIDHEAEEVEDGSSDTSGVTPVEAKPIKA